MRPNLWSAAAITIVLLAVGPAQAGPITVDADTGDWAGIPKAATDPSGDNPPGDLSPEGNDLLVVSFTQDAAHLYVLFEFSGDPAIDYSYLLLDTDKDTSTGAKSFFGSEYGLTFSPLFSFIGDARDGGWTSSDCPGALTVSYGCNFIEASAPLSILRVLTPGFDGSFRFDTFIDRLAEPVTYQPIPEPSSMFLFATSALTLLERARRRRKCRMQGR